MSVISVINDDPNVRLIGKYSYNNRFCLGEGAYGKVFLGSDTKNNSQVAIKQIDTKFIQQHDNYIKSQILSEIEILKKFNHPNIVRFIEIIETQNHIYIITEYCRDGDLKEMLNLKKFSEQEAFIALLNITNGFKELQKQGIIHRDLKPANILVDSGVFKIADFGFAKAVVKLGSTHMLKSLVGSPYYMAPQLLSNQQYCYKCDIWSLAVMYYEMVIGDLPWLASDPPSLLKKILQNPIVNRLKNCKITNFSIYFLERCLTVDEARRPSWDEVFQMVQQSQLYKQLQLNKATPSLQVTSTVEDEIRQSKVLESNSNSQTRSQVSIPSEEIIMEQQEFIINLQKLRQEMVFKHFLCTELLVNMDEFLQLCNDEICILKLIVVQTRLLTHLSNSVQGNVFFYNQRKIKDKEKQKPELFLTSKDLLKLKQAILQEHDYYCSFQRDVKDHIEKNKLSDSLKNDPDCKQFMDLDQHVIKNQNTQLNGNSILLRFGTTFLKMILHNFEKITQQIVQDDQQVKYLMNLSEQIMNYLRVLQNQTEDTIQVDYEDLFNTHSRQKDIQLYISIISTNLSALVLN